MRRVGRAIRDVREKRPVWSARLLFANPRDRFVRHVLTEVIALLRSLWRLDTSRAIEQNGHELAHLTAEKAVEFLKSRTGGPTIKRARDALFPGGDLMGLAKVARVIAVELEDFADCGAGVGPHSRRTGPRRA